MISRIWHCWTTSGNADTYERMLKVDTFPDIAAIGVSGFKDIQRLRRPADSDEVEFVMIMWFESWDVVKECAGDVHRQAYVPPQARAELKRFDDYSQHCEIAVRLSF